MVPRLPVLAAAAALAFGAVTYVALEGREVVVVRTAGGAGRARATRAWIAEDAEGLWIEAANPDRPFLHDLAAEPALELERGGTVRACRAEPLPGRDGHRRIRRLLAARYGWADAWVGRLTDTSRSVAVRLECAAPETR